MKSSRRPSAETLTSLASLGFTELEAEIYVFLLQSPPATGYGVAKGVGRTNANAYKALQGLERKGAVLVQEGESRLFRAVPVAELMSQLERRFNRARHEASSALEALDRQEHDHQIYSLPSREQVLERCRRMMEAAEHIVVADLWPGLVLELRSHLEETAARGVRVLVKIYKPVEMPGVEAVVRLRGEEITEALPEEGLSLNVDGRQHLLARLRVQGPPWQAIWTSSPFLSTKLYYSLIYEVILTDLQQAVRAGEATDRLEALLDRYADLHPITNRNAVFQAYVEALGLDPLGVLP